MFESQAPWRTNSTPGTQTLKFTHTHEFSHFTPVSAGEAPGCRGVRKLPDVSEDAFFVWTVSEGRGCELLSRRRGLHMQIRLICQKKKFQNESGDHTQGACVKYELHI